MIFILLSFSLTNSTTSFDVNLSYKPSEASIKKSSVYGFISIIRISGSDDIKLRVTFTFGSDVPSISSIAFISTFLQSKSPNALEIAKRPNTRPNTIYPP